MYLILIDLFTLPLKFKGEIDKSSICKLEFLMSEMLTRLHSERLKLYTVLPFLSAIWLNNSIMPSVAEIFEQLIT